MYAESTREVGPGRSTTGPGSIAQGVYGNRGNLELVVPAEDDGLWVFWFNSDLPGDPDPDPAVPPGSWSAGLRFAAGARYRQAVILQSPLGPGHLEVLALREDEVLESWYWSPGPGFQRRGDAVAEGVSAYGAAVETDGTLRAEVDGPGGRRAVLSPPVPYPERVWEERPASGVADDGSPYATALLVSAGAPIDTITPGTPRWTRSGRDGGTLEVTYRDRSGALVHVPVPEPRAVS